MDLVVTDDPRGSDNDPGQRARLKKAPNAYRTISEVADDLHIPQHVLRFWETKFQQVKPLKRGGGRRYYRPDDIILLRRIADLLYTQGYTIKGVQRLLREGGGLLSDDIPPPTADERAAAEGENHPTHERLIPGLPLMVPPLPLTGRATQGSGADPQAEHLRALLAEAVRELEALRALLVGK
ncbi:MerR family transcriptional regulator [Rhodopila sp.]|uniref:MerR family transcriptional regulator n=1 Tax=Rhodopila sp. TaxID=2480087 RepID=UPI003D0FC1A4